MLIRFMTKVFYSVCAILVVFGAVQIHAQDYVQQAMEGATLQQIQERWNAAHAKKQNAVQSVEKDDDAPESEENDAEELRFRRWEEYWSHRVLPDGTFPNPSIVWTELQKLRNAAHTKNSSKANQLMSTAKWKFMGPTTKIPTGGGGGRVACVRFNPDNMDEIWIGTPGGGLWKSTDLGVHWSTTTDSLPALGVSDIAINPQNTNQMFLATGDMDGGNTPSYGVLRSDDGGHVWKQTSLNFSITLTRQMSRIIINPKNPNIILCATSNGIFRSTDNGTTWGLVQAGYFRDMEFKPSDPNYIYASSGATIYRSTNGGSSFSRLTNGLTSMNGNRVALGVTLADPNYLYALVSNNASGFGGLYRSTNSGDSWTQMSVGGTSLNILNWRSDGSYSASDESQGQGSYDLAIAVSQSDPETIFCGGVNIWTSEDGGSHWKIVAQWQGEGAPYVHADVHDLQFVPDPSSDLLIACTDGGVFATQDGGAHWSDRTNGLGLLQFYRIGTNPVDPTVVVGGCQDNGTNLCRAGDWKNVKGADGMEAFFDNTGVYAYCTIYYGQMWRSQDGGNTFKTNVSPLGQRTGGWITPYIVNPKRPATLYGGTGSGIYRTDERGDYWYLFSKSPVGNTSALAMSEADTASLLATTGSRMWLTTNSGSSWKDATSGLSSGSYSNIAADPTRAGVFAVCYNSYDENNKVWITHNMCQKWENYTKKGLPNVPVNCAVFYKTACQNILFVGTDLGVFYTSEDGDSWQELNNGLPNTVIRDMDIYKNILHVGTYGRGLWQLTLPTENTHAEIRIATNTVCRGVPVQYFNESSGAIGTLQWSFEGGNPSQSGLSAPLVTYDTAGSYSATLRVRNDCGVDSVVMKNIVTVLPSPVVPAISRNINTLTVAMSGAKQWYLNGSPIPGATNDSYKFSTNGGYTVAVTDEHGCPGMSPIFDAIVSVSADDADGLQLFPNPANDAVHLTLRRSGMSGIRLLISDLQGKSVYQYEDAQVGNEWSKTISVRELAPGEYTIEIRTGDLVIRRRFVRSN